MKCAWQVCIECARPCGIVTSMRTIPTLLIGLAITASVFLAVPSAARASSLTAAQTEAIVSLLQSFDVSADTVAQVRAILAGTTVATTGSAVQRSCPALSNRLATGSTDQGSNGEVSQLQQFLGGTVSGYFGPATKALVGAWQASNGVVSAGDPNYGVVGPLTRATIANACATSSTAIVPRPSVAATEPQAQTPAEILAAARATQTATTLTSPFTISTTTKTIVLPRSGAIATSTMVELRAMARANLAALGSITVAPSTLAGIKAAIIAAVTAHKATMLSGDIAAITAVQSQWLPRSASAAVVAKGPTDAMRLAAAAAAAKDDDFMLTSVLASSTTAWTVVNDKMVTIQYQSGGDVAQRFFINMNGLWTFINASM